MAMVELAAERGAKKSTCTHSLTVATLHRAVLNLAEKIRRKICRAGQRPRSVLIGRYYAMDRDNRWDRVEKAMTC